MTPRPKLIIKDGEDEYQIPLSPKDFSTGSVGYSANGKVDIRNKDGELKSHTFNINVVEIGSKKSKDKKVDN